MDDVKIRITSRAGGALHLYQSGFWETPSFQPFVRGKRVRRKAGLPVYLPDPAFAPRRAKQ